MKLKSFLVLKFHLIVLPYWNNYILILFKWLIPAENEVDGDALFALTERAVELLIPIIGPRMKFLTKLDQLKAQPQNEQLQVLRVAPARNDIEDEEVNEQKGRYVSSP